MKYCEITVSTNHADSEIVADVMYEATGDGVCVVDKADLENETWDYAEEGLTDGYPKSVLVKGYCAVEKIEPTVAELQKRLIYFKNLSVWEISTKILDDSVWKDEWKKSYFAIPIGKITICPVWLDDGKSRNVLIDAGLAFGTGQHETTALCAELMQTFDMTGKTALDVGCGSGVLGLSALKLGAENAVLVDNDRQAAETAEKNVSLNKFNGSCRVVCGNLADEIDEKFDFVFANLTAPILLELRKNIGRVLKKDSLLILSGILNPHAEKVEKTYSSFELIKKSVKGEWTALLLYKT